MHNSSYTNTCSIRRRNSVDKLLTVEERVEQRNYSKNNKIFRRICSELIQILQGSVPRIRITRHCQTPWGYGLGFSWFMITSVYSLSVDNNSSVGMQTLPRNKTTILARKENETCRNLARLSWATHRCAAELLLGGGIHSCWDKRRPDYTKVSFYSKFAFVALTYLAQDTRSSLECHFWLAGWTVL